MIDLFPPYMRTHPAVEVCGDFLIALTFAQLELKEAMSGKQAADIKVKEAARGEPTSQNRPIPQGEVIGKVREFSMADAPV